MNNKRYIEIFNQLKNNELTNQEAVNLLKDIYSARKQTNVSHGVLQWQEQKLQNMVSDNRITLLIFNSNMLTDKFQKNIKQTGNMNTFYLQNSFTFKQEDESHFFLNFAVKTDLEKTFKSFKDSGNLKILYLLRPDHKLTAETMELVIDEDILPVFLILNTLLNLKAEQHIEIIFLYTHDYSYDYALYAALSGLIKTLAEESKKVKAKMITVGNMDDYADEIIDELFVADLPGLEIQYQDHKRYVKSFAWVKKQTYIENPLPLKQQGVYLITGGLGGLGIIFTEFLSREYKAHIILAGRSALDENKQRKLDSLKPASGNIQYHEVDITKKEGVKRLIEVIKKDYNRIDGIIHAAGIIKDNYINKKNKEEIQAVILPKVAGAFYLDLFTKDENLDFFVLFSSLAALGNPGQSDYAYANSFMDNFALVRNNLVSMNARKGKTLSLNWPYWAEGGMHVDQQTIQLIAQTKGLIPLTTAKGIEAFCFGLRTTANQLLVLPGNEEKIEKMFIIESPSSQHQDSLTAVSQIQETSIIQQIQAVIIDEVNHITKTDRESINPKADLEKYGFDSISFTTLANNLNKKLDIAITPAIFFEYTTTDSLIHFILKEYREELYHFFQKIDEQISDNITVSPHGMSSHVYEDVIISTSGRFDEAESNQLTDYSEKPDQYIPIAIIGIAGKMPDAENLEEFWKNLAAGRDCISVIPADRWDWLEYWGDPLKEDNKTNIKWGGFIKDIDKFDASFFNIAPREAIFMDPHHRLFIEATWNAIEDAGYKPSDYAGTYTGVFVGVPASEYSELLTLNNIPPDAYSMTGTDQTILPNRISYLLNLKGPSAPLFTACSSAFLAIHRAILAIHAGDCEQAIAGAVNLFLSPKIFISCNKAGMLALDGHCKTFDEKADGYARGEGVGVVLLKPLKKAINDHDHIYAIIKGSAENHGGHAKSLTAPNPLAQKELIIKAMEKADIDPSTVSYIEAHGTGTSLGDPIEINGLINAYKDLYARSGIDDFSKKTCALGSVKTIIGHLETAAGIAGLFKVLLSFKNNQLPPTINIQNINPYIQLDNTPFYIADKEQFWERMKSNDGGFLPRRAAISSFGYGGANAHIVLEEYISQPVQQPVTGKSQYLIILSARNVDALKRYALSLKIWLEAHKSHYSLDDIEYNLIKGREEYEERAAFLAKDVDDLSKQLDNFYNNTKGNNNFFQGNIAKKRRKVDNLLEEAEGIEFIGKIVSNKKLRQIAEMWISGVAIDWTLFLSNNNIYKIALPTYPFEKQRYWYTDLIPTNSKEDHAKIKKHSGKEGLFFFTPIWKEQSFINHSCELKGKKLLLFINESSMIHQLNNYFAAENAEVFYILPGNEFNKTSNQTCIINIYKIDDYIKVLTNLKDQNMQPDIICYLWAMDNIDTSQARLYYSVYALFFLLRAYREVDLEVSPFIAFCYKEGVDNAIYASLSGLAKSLTLLAPDTTLKIIRLQQNITNITNVIDFMKQEVTIPAEHPEIYYTGNKRFIKSLEQIELPVTGELPFRENGVYIITGGAGALGLLFARYIASKVKCNLILLGRSSLSELKEQALDQMKKNGAGVEYVSIDVGSQKEMERLAESLNEKYGKINGIIHAAGTSTDTLLFDKSHKEFAAELNAKITGAYVLDAITRETTLDFFILFGSTSAVLGDFGQGDYAIGNKFLNDFCEYREKLRKDQKRNGRTIVINWPLWKEGGMHLDAAAEDMYLKTSGMQHLENEDGLMVFEKILQSNNGNITLFKGDYHRILKFLHLEAAPQKHVVKRIMPGLTRIVKEKPAGAQRSKGSIKEHLMNSIKEIAAGILLVDSSKMDLNLNFGDMGFDSISLRDLSIKINMNFDLAFTPAIFFSQGTIEKLADHILQEFPEKAGNVTGISNETAIIEAADNDDNSPAGPENLEACLNEDLSVIAADVLAIGRDDLDMELEWNELGFDPVKLHVYAETISEQYNIELTQSMVLDYFSIRGLSSYLLEKFHDAICDYYDVAPGNYGFNSEPDYNASGNKIVTPLYIHPATKDVAIIGISGRFPGSGNLDEFWEHLEKQDCLVTEIITKRPYWKKFMHLLENEETKYALKWAALIDDYDQFDPLFFKISPDEAEFMDPQQRLFLECCWEVIENAGYKASSLTGKNIGVFVGVQFFDYKSEIEASRVRHSKFGTGISHAVLANRISYFFNFHGPSESIDTACSSSLVALHNAVKSIQTGESEMAITGGVSLMLTPGSALSAGKMEIISHEGRCKTFDKAADGYVKGEGIQAFLLKPLDNAVRDGDYIYAVVKSTAVNHGGQAHSLTAPNPEAQADLIIKAVNEGKIDPRTISYIECHGTGTVLGDPVEIDGLKTAFRKLFKEMKINSDNVNYCGLGSLKTNIGHLEPAAGTAGLMKLILAMQHKKLPGLATFKERNPYIELEGSPFYILEKTRYWEAGIDQQGNPLPRRAGVSSFGFGGTNAHAIVEEYANNIPVHDRLDKPDIFILSAKSEKQLKEYAEGFLKYINNKELNLERLLYVLKTGREHFNNRLAIIVKSVADLNDKLKQYVNNQQSAFIFSGKTDKDHGVAGILNNFSDPEIKAESWVKGLPVEWEKAYATRPGKTPLPTYPFLKKRFWVQPKKQDANVEIMKLLTGVLNNELLPEEAAEKLEEQE